VLFALAASIVVSAGCGNLREPSSGATAACDCPRQRPHVEEVPVSFHSGIAIVEAQIEGLDRPVRLAIDTGAPTVIRAELADRIAYEADPSIDSRSLTDASGARVEMEPILLDRLSVGSFVFDALPAVLVRSDVFDLTCPPIDGVLGTGGPSSRDGFLDQVIVDLDRDSGVLRLLDDPSLLEELDTSVVLARYGFGHTGERFKIGESRVAVAIDDEFDWAAIDTGSMELSTIGRDAFEKLGRSVDDPDVVPYRGSAGISVGGTPDSGRSWITTFEFEIGRITVRGLPIRVVETGSSPYAGLVLSQHFLRGFNLTLDYRHSELKLGLRASAIDLVSLPTQISFNVVDGKLVVIGLIEGGVAESSGVEIGDELIRVGGVEIDANNPALSCAIRLATDTRVDDQSYRFRRGDREFDVILPAKEPLSDDVPDDSRPEDP
jgi:hypothetical protein